MVREEEFETMLMDILEKKELSVLRQGAVCTAGQYREEMIAKKACLCDLPGSHSGLC